MRHHRDAPRPRTRCGPVANWSARMAAAPLPGRANLTLNSCRLFRTVLESKTAATCVLRMTSIADVGFATPACPQRNRCCVSDIQVRFSPLFVGFAASVPSGRNEYCISDIQMPTPPAGCRICNTGSFRLERVRHFRHPARSTHVNPRVATAFGRPLRQTCGLQQFSTSKRNRKCGKRRVCLDVGTWMSNLQHRFARGGTDAAFPTSSGPRSANPQFASLFRRWFQQTRSSPQFLALFGFENCCKRRVCRKRGLKTVATCGFAERDSQKLLQTYVLRTTRPARRPHAADPPARCPRPQR